MSIFQTRWSGELDQANQLVVQLSLRKGFKVKVLETLHHRKPVVATGAGGIPLQNEHGKSGSLVEVGDTQSVADHLSDLYSNNDLQIRVSNHAKVSVIDGVGAIGNDACWLCFASNVVGCQVLQPGGKWITDMTRAETGQNYQGVKRTPTPGN
ncbi:hypothetical protein HOY82DRAFT_599379 [Tuber indicum]|nr:hypothetical protein HOY82DRAFT_599379 [Tuber indicum]